MPSTYSNLLYHIVFSTKDRAPLIAGELQEELYRYLAGIVRNEGGILLEIGGIEDHVHLLAKFKSVLSVSDMLHLIKTNSSKWIHEVKQHERFGWQEGYAAFSVSESQVVAVRRYIFVIKSRIIDASRFRRSLWPCWSGMALSMIRGICGIDVAPHGALEIEIVVNQGLAPLAT